MGIAVGVVAGGGDVIDGELAGVADGGDDEGDLEGDVIGGLEEVVGAFAGDTGVVFGDGEGALSAFTRMPVTEIKRTQIETLTSLIIFAF